MKDSSNDQEFNLDSKSIEEDKLDVSTRRPPPRKQPSSKFLKSSILIWKRN
jgi:hypothetical protein